MEIPDLRTGPPPRWNVTEAGIVWLPRFAAKVRAHGAGRLGTYLLGQSPIDDEFLQAARLSYATFIELVRGATDDAGVLAGIEARSPGAIERLKLWSTEMPVRRALHLRILDLDDGYGRPGWMDGPHRVANAAFVPLVALLRAIRPLRG